MGGEGRGAWGTSWRSGGVEEAEIAGEPVPVRRPCLGVFLPLSDGFLLFGTLNDGM